MTQMTACAHDAETTNLKILEYDELPPHIQ